MSQASLTVEMALRVPALRRGAPQVLAGRRSLNRPIRWAHSSEVPDISALLKGRELLLMTGMGVGRRPADQRRFVRELAEHDVAALVVELGQVFRGTLPPAMVEEAEVRGLPLVALRRQVPFVEVTEAIHSSIVNRQLEVIARADDLHARLTELMLEGAGIPEILAVLATAIGNPVLLERAGHGVVYHAAHRASPEEVLAAWELAGETVEAAVTSPVMAGRGRAWGRLVALPLESPLGDFDRAAVERAVALIALALLRGGQESALAGRQRGNFLADVLRGRVAAALGLAGRHRRLLAAAVAPAERPDTTRWLDDPGWTAVWPAIGEGLEAAGVPALLGWRPAEGDTLVLLDLPAGTSRAAAAELLARLARAAARRHLGPPDAVVVVAADAVGGWEEVPRALRRAADTVSVARGAPPRPWHDATVPDLDRLLWSLREDPFVAEFVEQRLAPLLEHDRARAAKLLPTLEALCDHHWHKADAARALSVNRQSLYPRLERLGRVLGADLEDPETRIGLELAVRARRHGVR